MTTTTFINGDGGYRLLAAYIGGPVAQADWFGPKVGGHLAPFLYSSREPSELSQWLCYDDSTINIVLVIIIIIIIITCTSGRTSLCFVVLHSCPGAGARLLGGREPTERVWIVVSVPVVGHLGLLGTVIVRRHLVRRTTGVQ